MSWFPCCHSLRHGRSNSFKTHILYNVVQITEAILPLSRQITAQALPVPPPGSIISASPGCETSLQAKLARARGLRW